MSIFKKKNKDEISSGVTGKQVEYSVKNHKEEKKAIKKKEAKKEKRHRFKKSFKNLFAEAKKVTWPSWKKTLSNTGIVILLVFIFTLIILLVDLLFTTVLLGITEHKIDINRFVSSLPINFLAQ